MPSRYISCRLALQRHQGLYHHPTFSSSQSVEITSRVENGKGFAVEEDIPNNITANLVKLMDQVEKMEKDMRGLMDNLLLMITYDDTYKGCETRVRGVGSDLSFSGLVKLVEEVVGVNSHNNEIELHASLSHAVGVSCVVIRDDEDVASILQDERLVVVFVMVKAQNANDIPHEYGIQHSNNLQHNTRYSPRARDNRRNVPIDTHYPECQPEPRKALTSVYHFPLNPKLYPRRYPTRLSVRVRGLNQLCCISRLYNAFDQIEDDVEEDDMADWNDELHDNCEDDYVGRHDDCSMGWTCFLLLY
ncbi:Uncharacterized protein TCM_027361 [Theobroma cacao]|uniref:Uncharacterized protein n=1 Tax=Theobroma cacao TaxID=3641 RepID=A0A061G969_THECC|nr:Uncharacterized protein TCM_027361 [Theobroma cacao]